MPCYRRSPCEPSIVGLRARSRGLCDDKTRGTRTVERLTGPTLATPSLAYTMWALAIEVSPRPVYVRNLGKCLTSRFVSLSVHEGEKTDVIAL
jgi:hypothetical protein